MADQLQLRGGTTNEHSTFTGALREVTVDTDKDTLIVHDAATAGGHPLLREDGSNSALSLGTAGTPSIKFTGDTNTGIYSPGADQVAISTGGTGRLFVNANGRVGVGTSSPVSHLHVNGTGSVSMRVSSSDNNLFLQAGASSGSTFHEYKTLYRIVDTDNGERLRIDSSGRVGIGTSTAPSGQINLTVNRAGGPGSIQLAYNGASGGAIVPGSAGGLEFFTYTGSIGSETYTERMRIDSSGRVGVGTTSPGNSHQSADDLVIGDYSSSGVGISINTTTSGSGNIYFGDASGSNRRGRIEYDHTNDAFRLYTADSERFRIDSSGRVGVGTSSPGQKLTVVGADALFDNPGGQFDLLIGDGNARYYGLRSPAGAANLQLRNHTANTTIATFTSGGNVGVGTASPTFPLQIETTATGTTAGSNGVMLVQSQASGRDAHIRFGDSVNATARVGYLSNSLYAYVNAQERVRIDSSGRVGIGTSGPQHPLHVVGTSLVTGDAHFGASRASQTGFTQHVNIEGTDASLQLYQTTTGSSWELGNDNTGLFRILNGGTDRFAITSAGNVGIGTTSPVQKMHIAGGSESVLFQAQNSSGSAFFGIRNGAYGALDTNDAYIYKSGGDITLMCEGASDVIKFAAGSSSEKARIDSSGRLLVGTSTSLSSNALFQVSGNANIAEFFTARTDFYGPIVILNKAKGSNASPAAVSSGDHIGTLECRGYDGSNYVLGAHIRGEVDGTPGTNDMPGRLVFSTTADGASTPTEHMRLTQYGSLRVTNSGSYPSTSGTYHAFSANSPNDLVLRLNNTSSTTPYGINLVFDSAAPNDSTRYFFQCVDSTTGRAYIYTNGGIHNYQSNDANLCDEREKKNIEALGSTWGCLKNWDLKKFHYNEDDDTDDKRYGVIAQQVAPHCPEVITEWTKQRAEDAVLDEDGNVVTPAKEEIVRMGVKEQQMMWMAIKALQEAQTRIETLEAEVAALKSA